MPYTILVVDDDPEIRETVNELLSSRHERVVSAANGEDGLVVARAVHADLILLDYHMPDMDGLAVLERLKADEATRRVPVVAMTSSTAEHANALSRGRSRSLHSQALRSGRVPPARRRAAEGDGWERTASRVLIPCGDHSSPAPVCSSPGVA